MGYNYEPDHWDPPGARPGHFTRDFHGAAVIADDGSEIPITESMVAQALDRLHADWERANAARGCEDS